MTNPLIEKFYELHPEKKEEPKVIKTENAKVEIKGTQIGYTYTDEISVATSNTNISITKPPSLIIYDPDDLNVSFQQVVDKIQQGKAQVASMSMERDIMSIMRNKIIFEVYVDDL
jgi:hypothetical protein